MTTWFDKERGERSGRIIPTGITPPDGSRVFILGAEDNDMPVSVSENDFTEIRQLVNLTDYDLVGSTMDAIGTVMGSYTPPSGWKHDPDELFRFNFNYALAQSLNLVAGGFPLVAQGDMTYPNETYSPDQTKCRGIPAGSSTAKLTGINTPQAIPTDLDAYTFQWWQNFDSDAIAGSSGFNEKIFELVSGLNQDGFGVRMVGITGMGAHQWHIYVDHYRNGTYEFMQLNGYMIDPSPGWQMYTLRFDLNLAWPNQLELWVDNALASGILGVFTVGTGQPDPSEVVQYSGPMLTGEIDSVRMINRRMTDAEIIASYNESTSPGVTVNFEWVMQMRIDGIVYAERAIASDEERRWTDFVAPVRQLTGVHEVAFRLQLKEAV